MPRFPKTILILTIAVFLFGAFGIASGAFNEQINYQGKLTDSSSIPVSDGNHCMEFALYTVATNGSSIWSEEWDSATSYAATNSGLFSVLLGTHQSLSSVNFNQTALYLEVRYDPGCDNVYEEIFSPRKRFGAVPSAFESKQLGGKAETAFGTLSESEAVIGAWTFSDLLTVTEVPTGALVNQGSLYINPATATADYTLLGLAVGGAEKFRVDEDGDVVIEGNVSFTGSQTISTTAGDLVLNPTGNLALSSNSITGLGTGITASGALTISTTGASNLTLTPGTGLTTTGSTFQITGGLLDVDTYADIAYSGATTALTVTQSGTGGIVDFKDGASSVFTISDGGNATIANISATTGSAFSVTRNLVSGSTDSSVISFIQDNAGDDQEVLTVRQDGTGSIASLTNTATATSDAFTISNLGTGNAITIDQDGNVGTAVATDGALFVENTGNTDIGLNVYSNIGATSAAGLVYFTADNTGFDQTVLTIGQDGTGNILDIQKSGSSVFEVTQSLVKISQPLQINVAGDVGFSRSVEFTSTGASHIFSEGPFTIAAGDPNSAENLTLTTRTTEESPETGTADAGSTTTTIVDAAQTSWVSDEFVGGRVEITAGTNVGEIREICANASELDTTITVSTAFSAAIDATSVYAVYRKAGDILVNISGTNMTSGGFKVLGMDTNAIFRISPEGDVGIGTMSIAARLTVTQTATGDIINLKDGANNTVLDITDEGQADFKPSAFDNVFYYTNTPSWTDKTTEAKTSGGTAFDILAATTDYFYMGLDNTFDSIYFDIATAGGGITLVAQYSQGSSTWVALSVSDNTSALASDGTVTFTAPADWATDTVNSVDNKYWVRISASAISSTPTAYSVSPTTGTRFAVYGQQGDSSAAFSIDDKGDIAITGDITYPTSNSPKRTIVLTAAGAITPTIANGAAQTKVDGTYHTYYVLDFDDDDPAANDEIAYWHWTMPDSYDDGTIDITYYWEATATSGTVTWCFKSKGLSPNISENIDPNLTGLPETCETDTADADANDLYSITESAAASNFTKGEYVIFKVYRDVSVDTMVGDARLVKVKIEYSVSSESD